MILYISLATGEAYTIIDTRNDLFAAMDVTKIKYILYAWLDETISYHGFLAGLLSGFKGYSLNSNHESGDGRYDIALMKSRRDQALAQIEEKRYEDEHPGNTPGCCCIYVYVQRNRHYTLRYSACFSFVQELELLFAAFVDRCCDNILSLKCDNIELSLCVLCHWYFRLLHVSFWYIIIVLSYTDYPLVSF